MTQTIFLSISVVMPTPFIAIVLIILMIRLHVL